MKLKMRKVKSFIRWAKKRLEEKYQIKIHDLRFPKDKLKIAQKGFSNKWEGANTYHIMRGNIK